MYTNQQLCEKIRQLYPEIGRCGVDMAVSWDMARDVWTVDFKKGEQLVRHYLDDREAAACLEGEKCIRFGIDFSQFL